MLNWLTGFLKKPNPSRNWVVAIEDGRLTATDAVGESRSVELSQIGSIAIKTDGSGPWGDDFAWIFYRRDGSLACIYPLGADGEQEVLRHLQLLPGFDSDALIKASSSTSVATFWLWRAPTAASENAGG